MMRWTIGDRTTTVDWLSIAGRQTSNADAFRGQYPVDDPNSAEQL
ncbi:hypothetical protein [Diaminobutyricibacter sp. McL0608]